MERLLVLNGPNLNRLGKREPDIYGSETITDVVKRVETIASPFHVEVRNFQSNHEGELIDQLHSLDDSFIGVVFNPGAYTHTSIALRDAISSISIPVIEVHISNVHQRETFRHTSLLAPVCLGQVVGLGVRGYELAARALLEEKQKG
ncbi:type II 3-dehydroquinate dehydratase [Radiobacillus kanasensis]|uniref:type II 3-dehydroquinate dehydratase n=1 Tax=Radiobacillus kanasensis TaxID=2844358 RepID=UPI001E28C838|nr:type II 3-dehydroquinate dehydratase [Radiobacillus kanasensis]UFT97745.1 type II 3-dehydroquinate dehydratase [Radiobacillus kanasensis]